MKKPSTKTKYEKPKMITLGNLATGYGAACHSGSVATGTCLSGSSVDTGTGQCGTGSNATNHCNSGGANTPKIS